MSLIFGYIISILISFEFLNTVKFYKIINRTLYSKEIIPSKYSDTVINLDYFRQ